MSSNYEDYTNVQDAIVAFGQLARQHRLNVGVEETISASAVATTEVIQQINTFRYALRAVYCCSQEEQVIFDHLFNQFWRQDPVVNGKTTYFNQSNLQKKSQGSLVMLGTGNSEESDQEGKNVSGANTIARLRKTDFSKVADIESAFLEEIAMKLWQQMSRRLKRRQKVGQKKGSIDMGKTIRRSVSHGGEPIELLKKQKTLRRQRLIVLLDVSGSMDKYSFFLLRFICVLRQHFEKIEAFVFSTHLVRITDYLHAKNLAAILPTLSAKADNWSSGTQIGVCFNTFNQTYAKRVLNGRSTVIILSDGLDTGNPEVLAKETAQIQLRTKQLIWLNPLKGMSGYEPIQKGMSAALPSVDVFKSAHNLDSILELEKYLMYV